MSAKYYIPDDTDCGQCEDSARWIGYSVLDCSGETLHDALRECYISKTDQDGGEVGSPVHYLDAPASAQRNICTILGVTVEDADNAFADHDPTPYCSYCNSMTAAKCKCGPRAQND